MAADGVTISGNDIEETPITYYGSAADDAFIGGADGEVTFFGDAGADDYTATADNTFINYGGSSDDITVDFSTGQGFGGDAEGDTYTGVTHAVTGSGDDTLIGSGADEAFYGGDGVDTLSAGAGDDRLYGGGGDDLLTGGAGDDSLQGQGGTDTAVFSGQWSDYTITDNGWTVTITDNRPGSPDGVDRAEQVETFRFSDGQGGHIDVARADLLNDAPTDIDLSASSVTENATGAVVGTLTSTDADSGIASESATYSVDDARFEVVDSGGGVMQLKLVDGQALDFEAEDGSVDVEVTVTDAAGESYAESFTISVDDVAEAITLADGGVTFTDMGVTETSIRGGDGHDIITGSSGDDAIDGGTGTDTAIFSGNYADYAVAYDGPSDTFTLTGPDGTDTVTGVENFQFDDGVVSDLVLQAAADQTIVGTASGETIATGTGNDDITGAAGNDSIDAGDGDDVIRWARGDGSDTIDGGTGTDTLYVDADVTDIMLSGSLRFNFDEVDGSGEVLDLSNVETVVFNDATWDMSTVTYGTSGADNYTGGAGADIYRGEADDDVIDGAAGDDFLFGGGGDDTLTGGAGADYLHGGDGGDRMIGGAGDDFIDGDEGADTAVFAGDIQDYSFAINSDGLLTVTDANTGDGDEGTDTLRNIETLEFNGVTYDMSSLIDGADGNETGTSGADFMVANNPGGSTLLGVEGSDVLIGGDGADSLQGEGISGDAGVDFYHAGAGDDTMYIGDGGDTVYAGTGDDTIYLRNTSLDGATIYGGDGTDEIQRNGSGFTIYNDTVIDSIEVLDAANSTTGLDLDLSGAGTFDLSSVTTLIDINTIVGDSSDQVVDFSGLTMAATFDLGAGDDTLVVGSEAFSIDGGAGTDTVSYAESTGGVWVNFDTGMGFGSYSTGDSYSNVENAIGSDYGDAFSGDSADNAFTGGAGDDTIHGGDGSDTAIFSGAYADYTVTDNGDGTLTVTDNNAGDGDDGSDTLSNVEFLQFSDQTVATNQAPTDITATGNAALALTPASDGETIVTGEIVNSGSNNSVDHWEITHSGGDLTIDVLAGGFNGSSLDSYIRLFLDNGDGTFTEVGSNDDGAAGADGSSSGFDSYLSMSSLAAGTYVLAVGEYSLSQAEALNTGSTYANSHGSTPNGGEYQVTFTGDATVAFAENPDSPGNDWGDVNNVATVVSATPASDGGVADGATIATVSAVDADSGDTHTFTLTDDAGGLFDIDSATGVITVDGGGSEVDAATLDGQSITVEVTDSQGATYSETITFQFGSDGIDTITGGTGDDVIYGQDGADTITGGSGDDVIFGGDEPQTQTVGTETMTADSAADLTNAGWSGANESSGGNSFGFSSSSFANGSGSGEIGGTFARTTTEDSYTDTSIGTFTESDSFSFSMNISVEDVTNANGELFIGFHGADDSFAGWVIRGTGSSSTYTLDDLVTGSGGDYGHGGSGWSISEGADLTLNFSYNNGNVSYSFSGDSSGSNSYSGVTSYGALNLTEFGIKSGAETSNSSSATFDVYMDDVTYSSATPAAATGDTITGGAGDDVIDGGDGDDIAVYAGDIGDFSIDYDGANLIVTDLNAADGDEGTDTLTNIETLRFNGVDYTPTLGTTGVDTLTGGSDADLLIGGDGNDTIDGGSDHDILFGGAGDDAIYSGSGQDTIDGGEGSDTIYLDGYANGGVNTIIDTGTGGTDTLVLHSGSSFEIQSDFSAATSGIEVIDGSSLTGESIDTTSSSAVNWDFSGVTLTGVDEIEGSDVNDTITGSAGSDVIIGDQGDDTLDGGAGTDTAVYSGDRADFTIEYNAGSGEFTITDTDTADGSDEGRDTVQGVELIEFNGIAYQVQEGTTGADTFSSAAGRHLIVGGDGDDVFGLEASSGDDFLDGGAMGSDRIQLDGFDDTFVSGDATSHQTTDWTLTLTSGSIVSTSGSQIDLSQDASGSITYGGEEVEFSNIEQITWNP